MNSSGNDWSVCPDCGKKVKSKNLRRHLERVHDMTQGEAKAVVEKEEREKSRTESAVSKKRAAAALAIVIIIVLSITAVAFLMGSDNDGENGNGGPGPSGDPNRVEFTTDDGFKLVGSYYKAKAGVLKTSTVERPTLILVHGINEKRKVWNDKGLVEDALNWGFNVLTYDIRGFGESVYKNGKKYDVTKFVSDDFKNMPQDVRAAVQFVETSYSTNGKMAVVGASIGANAALNAAVYEYSIVSLVLLSPSLNYQGITTYDPIYDYRERPVFIAAGSNEFDIKDDCEDLATRARERDAEREVKLEFYSHENPEEFLHGTNLFKTEQFRGDLKDWLITTMITG